MVKQCGAGGGSLFFGGPFFPDLMRIFALINNFRIERRTSAGPV